MWHAPSSLCEAMTPEWKRSQDMPLRPTQHQIQPEEFKPALVLIFPKVASCLIIRLVIFTVHVLHLAEGKQLRCFPKDCCFQIWEWSSRSPPLEVPVPCCLWGETVWIQRESNPNCCALTVFQLAPFCAFSSFWVPGQVQGQGNSRAACKTSGFWKGGIWRKTLLVFWLFL